MLPTRRISAAAAALAISLMLSLGLAAVAPGSNGQPAGGHYFTGIDGLVYTQAAPVVAGTDGDLYFGSDFDVACHFGPRIHDAMERISRLARLIRRSGRRVLFTVPPDKALVVSDHLPTPLPHSPCDDAGLTAQARVLDQYRDPTYLPLRETLVRDERQVYWKTDLHWTTVGGADYSQKLAYRLRPRLAKIQRFSPEPRTMVGVLNAVRGVRTPETVDGVRSAGPATVRTAPGSVQDYNGHDLTFNHSWVSTPTRKTWPGRTAIVGDSFTFVALGTLRPLFARGHFVWITHVPVEQIVHDIVRSNTVVLEQIEFDVQKGLLGRGTFFRRVRDALAGHPPPSVQHS